MLRWRGHRPATGSESDLAVQTCHWCLGWTYLSTCSRSKRIIYRGKKKKPGASLVPVFRTPKQLLLLFVNRAARSDSQLTKEVPVQVDQNNNKAGVRSSNEERTDPNNGRAMVWQGMRSDSGASHSLFIAARSRVSYLFFLSGMSSKGSWHKNKQPVMAHPCDCQRRPSDEGGSEVTAWCRRPGRDSPWLLTASLSLPPFPLAVIDMRGQCERCMGLTSAAVHFLSLALFLAVGWGRLLHC